MLDNEIVLKLLESKCESKLIVFGHGYKDSMEGKTVWHKLD